MGELLSPVQVSGGFPVTNGNPPTMIARIPRTAMQPAVLTVTNRDLTAIMYLKWLRWDRSGNTVLQTADAAIQLSAGQAYTWDNPPAGAVLVAQSSVDGAIMGVDGNWSMPSEAQLL